MFMIMRVDRTELSSIKIMQNSKLLNNVSSKYLIFVSLLDRFCAVISNSRRLEKWYTVPFRAAPLRDTRRDMVSSNIVPEVEDNMFGTFKWPVCASSAHRC